jgi:hypothetical protein
MSDDAGALTFAPRRDFWRLPQFDRPGTLRPGSVAEQHKTRRAGTVKVRGVIDDHAWLLRLHARKIRTPFRPLLRRAAEWFSEQAAAPSRRY